MMNKIIIKQILIITTFLAGNISSKVLELQYKFKVQLMYVVFHFKLNLFNLIALINIKLKCISNI